MRGEFIGVWSETWRELWQPLIDQPLGEGNECLPDDIFCELYRELSKALRKPGDESAVNLLLGDAIALREAFDAAARRSNHDLAYDVVKDAFDNSGATAVEAADQRRALLDTALMRLFGEQGGAYLDLLLLEHAQDAARVDAAWERATERIINDPRASRDAFRSVAAKDIAGERVLVGFFEGVNDVLAELESLGGDALTNSYFTLLAAFIDKFSLRYELRRPCTLCPTVPGLFASLYRRFSRLALVDQNVARRLRDASEAVQDLRLGQSEGRIANCVAKQVMLLEAVAAAGGVHGSDLSAICSAVHDWPHPAIRASLLNAYGFASDFPGIRHGTPSSGMARDVDMRDMVAMSVLLAAFAPYLNRDFDGNTLYLNL